jgi:hypothetical protein
MIKNETHKPPRFRQVSSGAYLLQSRAMFLRNKSSLNYKKNVAKTTNFLAIKILIKV